MADGPLRGKGIVITRPLDQAGALAEAVEAAGGRALRYPAVAIVEPPAPAALRQTLGRLERFDLAIFVSPTAVEKAFPVFGAVWPDALQAAAVGPGTRRALERRGVVKVIAPARGADSEALLASPALASVAGKRVLIVRGAGGRELLGDTLERRGARVEYAQCYRRVRAETDIGPLRAEWSRGAVHAVTVFSRGALANFIDLLGEGRALLLGTPLFASHARIGEAAAALGVARVEVAGPGEREMIERLVAYFRSPSLPPP